MRGLERVVVGRIEPQNAISVVLHVDEEIHLHRGEVVHKVAIIRIIDNLKTQIIRKLVIGTGSVHKVGTRTLILTTLRSCISVESAANSTPAVLQRRKIPKHRFNVASAAEEIDLWHFCGLVNSLPKV
ncbi:hypothetical protein ACS49_04060 [Bacillus cereus]|nr:hypothetical protein ACS49_04060 [Bacillus cereus]